MSHPYAPSAPPLRAPAGRGLAVAAMVLGIVAVLGCYVPILNVGSILIAVVGLVLGIVSLARSRAGRGMAITGVALSAIAVVVAVLVNLALGAAVENADPARPDVSGGAGAPAPGPTIATAPGDDALAIGAPAQVGDYTVTVSAVNQDATQVIADANRFNTAATGRYVLVDLTATYTGTAAEANPWIDLRATYQATDARNYDQSSCSVVVPQSAFDQPGLRTGGTATYQVCFDVPATAIAGSVVSVEQILNFEDDAVVWRAG
ncbi:DUF4190 domain-containing protein [Kineococcus sp. SYSU DK006]|uniref:DUF4190 domain-containing protein n=1 Tax=Kineococcus sp. SYSU DK006 TaxID=3383127 RepID=UPI003D7EA018